MDGRQKYGLFLGGFLLLSGAFALLMYASAPEPELPARTQSSAVQEQSAQAQSSQAVPHAEPAALTDAVEIEMCRGNCSRALFAGTGQASLSVAELGELPASAQSEAVKVAAADGESPEGTLRFAFSQHFGAPDGETVLLLKSELRDGYPTLCPFADAAGQDGADLVLDFEHVSAGTYLLVDREGWMRDNPGGVECGAELANSDVGFWMRFLPGIHFTELEFDTADATYNLDTIDRSRMTDPEQPAYFVERTGEVRVQMIRFLRENAPEGLMDVRAEWVYGFGVDEAAALYGRTLEDDDSVSLLRSERIAAERGDAVALFLTADPDSHTEQLTAFCELSGNEHILLTYRWDEAYHEVFSESLWNSCALYRQLK